MARRDDFGDEGFFETLMRRKGQTPMPPSMARLLMLVAGLAVLATVIAVAWATWPSGDGRVDEDDLPVMQAAEDSYKIKPEEPGGMAVPNKDSTIFETLNSSGSGKAVENLLDDPEEPMTKEQVFGKEESKPEEKPVQLVEEKKEPEKPATPVSKPEPPKKEPVKEEVKKELPKPVAGGGSSYIQFASVKSEADAKMKWNKLQSQYSDLKSLPLRVQKADVAGKGTFYRVQAGPMPLDRAQSLCTKIKSSKGDCLVIK